MGTLMTTEADDHRASTLVWIDARGAVIVRMEGDRARIERVESEVPAHHRATGHVRHDPAVRHGGGGSPQSAGEPHRIEHLNRFVGDIANRLAAGDDLLILGPGTVHERLARQLSESDGHHGRHRDIACEASPPRTDRQLVARLRRFGGVEPRRHSVGAYRWSEPSGHRPSGQADLPPRRVVSKPPRERGQEAPEE
jgi:hypothetical protein